MRAVRRPRELGRPRETAARSRARQRRIGDHVHDRSAHRPGSPGSSSMPDSPTTSGIDGGARGDHRRSARHRLHEREPEAFISRRINERSGAAVQRAQRRFRDRPESDDRVGHTTVGGGGRESIANAAIDAREHQGQAAASRVACVRSINRGRPRRDFAARADRRRAAETARRFPLATTRRPPTRSKTAAAPNGATVMRSGAMS